MQAVVITNVADEDRTRLTEFEVVPLDMRRASHHPLRELKTLIQVYRLLRDLRPRLLHAVGLKPVLYGSFAAWLLGMDVVCALAGMGYLFTAGSLRARLVRRMVVIWMRLMFLSRRTRVVLQNDDDAEKLIGYGVAVPSQVVIIRGSGVDLDHFQPLPEPQGEVVFAVVCRMLADKGIREVVLAARLLHWKGISCRVQLIGDPDCQNLSSLSRAQIETWVREGVVEWAGYITDVREVWRTAHVCVLPSYREGLPKALLEAAACGRAIITTDVPGCCDVVTDGVEGLLVPSKDWLGLAAAMERLALSPDLRRTMGAAARQRAEREFSQTIVVDQTLALYRTILDAA